MPEDLKLLQIGSSQLPPPFRGLHSPGVRKHCQIIFACYFRKSSTGGIKGSTEGSTFFLHKLSPDHHVALCRLVEQKVPQKVPPSFFTSVPPDHHVVLCQLVEQKVPQKVPRSFFTSVPPDHHVVLCQLVEQNVNNNNER